MAQRKRILAVASIGGHWVQLRRIMLPLSANYEIAYASTHEKCATQVDGDFYHVADFSRWDAWRIVPAFFRALRVLHKSRPDVVVTTGAAPGLVMLIAARLTLHRAVWIDSIANIEKLSACGRIASHIASRTYTQWPHLADKRIVYKGNVL